MMRFNDEAWVCLVGAAVQAPPQAVPSQPDETPVDATQGAASRHAERESRAGASCWHCQHHEKALAKVEMMR